MVVPLWNLVYYYYYYYYYYHYYYYCSQEIQYKQVVKILLWPLQGGIALP